MSQVLFSNLTLYHCVFSRVKINESSLVINMKPVKKKKKKLKRKSSTRGFWEMFPTEVIFWTVQAKNF